MMMTVLKLLMESAEVIIFSLIKTLVKYHVASSPEDLALYNFILARHCSLQQSTKTSSLQHLSANW
jgi:hypothetical protein